MFDGITIAFQVVLFILRAFFSETGVCYSPLLTFHAIAFVITCKPVCFDDTATSECDALTPPIQQQGFYAD